MEKFDPLSLDNQICFPLYAIAKEITRRYAAILSELGLTYTQYIAMMVLWEEKRASVKQLGKRLYLDSGTLTPLLLKLEKKGFILREKSKEDGRYLDIVLTEKGEKLREKALNVPLQISSCLQLDVEDAIAIKTLCHKLLQQLEE